MCLIGEAVDWRAKSTEPFNQEINARQTATGELLSPPRGERAAVKLRLRLFKQISGLKNKKANSPRVTSNRKVTRGPGENWTGGVYLLHFFVFYMNERARAK